MNWQKCIVIPLVFLGLSASGQYTDWRNFNSLRGYYALEAHGSYVYAGTGRSGVQRIDITTGEVETFDKSQWGIGFNDVHAIHKNDNGEMWVGTLYNGMFPTLGHFDGSTWTTYDGSNSPLSLSYLNIPLTVDGNNHLWIADAESQTLGVYRFDGNEWQFFSEENSLMPNAFATGMLYHEGAVWIATQSGLVSIEDDQWTIYNFSTPGLFSSSFGALAADSDGNIWTADNNFVYKYDGETWQSFSHVNANLFGPTITDMCADGLGNVYVASRNTNVAPYVSGITKYNGSTWEVLTPSPAEALPNGALLLTADSENQIWVTGSQNRSVVAITDEGWLEYAPKSYFFPGNSLSMEASGYPSRAWFGTFDALVQFNGEEPTVFSPENSGLPANIVQVIKYAPNGDLWMFTNGGSFYDGVLIKYVDDEWTYYTTANSELEGNVVRAIDFDPEGRVWVSTNAGLFRIDGDEWTIYQVGNSDIHTSNLYDLAITDEGTVWVGSLEGVSKFENNTWTLYNSENSALSFDRVSAIHADGEGRVWVALRGQDPSTDEGEIAMWQDESLTIFDPSNTGFESMWIRDIDSDSQGKVWIAFGQYNTSNQIAVSFYDGETWTGLNARNSGIVFNFILNISVDSDDRLWVNTLRGVSVFDPDGTLSITPNPFTDREPHGLTVRNFPNPFGQQTTIQYQLRQSGPVTATLYDMMGKKVETWFSEVPHQAGQDYSFTFDGIALPNGIFILEMIHLGRKTSLKILKTQ